MKSLFQSLIILSIMVASSCSEFLEVSIEKESVVLLSPGEHAETDDNDINFMWEKAANTFQYQLQIASPSFIKANIFYADTILEKTSFKIDLQPGQYEWRVKGFNGSSETGYSVRAFTLHESESTE